MALKLVNLGITFLLELCMLAALAFAGFQVNGSLYLKIGLAIGAPLLAAVIWGRFMAPTAARRLTGISYLLLKLILFAVAAIALVFAGQPALAVIFATVSVINQVLLIAWHQDTVPIMQ